MAGDHDPAKHAEFGNIVARYTFILTVVFAALFVGVVILFIL